MGRKKNPNKPVYEFWQSRIPKDMADELRRYGVKLVELKKIVNAENYEITHFALKQLLRTLQKTFPDATPVNVVTAQ